MDVDEYINCCLKNKQEVVVPDNLSEEIMDNIYQSDGKNSFLFYTSLRVLTAVSIVVFVFSLSIYFKLFNSTRLSVGYYSYIPSSYSEKVALSGNSITKSTIYAMITSN